MSKEKVKNPLHRKWWFWVIVVIVVIVAINGIDDDSHEKQNNNNVDTAQEKSKNTKKKVDKKEKKDDTPEFTKDDMKGLKDSWTRIMDESNNTIHRIEFEDDKRYDLVDIFIDDSFKELNKNEKQAYVDKFGGKVMGNVRSRIYHSDTSDKIWVYFKYMDGKMAAEPKMLDEGWKIK